MYTEFNFILDYLPSKTFRPNKSLNPNLNPTELRHPRQNSASVSASVAVGTHFLQIVTIPTCGSDLNSDPQSVGNGVNSVQFRLGFRGGFQPKRRTNYYQTRQKVGKGVKFRLVQTRIQGWIPTQKTHQLLRGRKWCGFSYGIRS